MELVEAQDAPTFVHNTSPAVDNCRLRITATIGTDIGNISSSRSPV